MRRVMGRFGLTADQISGSSPTGALPANSASLSFSSAGISGWGTLHLRGDDVGLGVEGRVAALLSGQESLRVGQEDPQHGPVALDAVD